MNKHATKCKSATENYMLKFPTVSSVSSDSIDKEIIDDIVKTAESSRSYSRPKGNYPLLLKMMGICIFPLHCCTLYFRNDCLHVHF
jgi:hypothetical protein